MKWIAAMLLAVSVAGCGGDNDHNSVVAPQQTVSFVGTWKLQTINGMPLPYILDQIGEDKLELLEAGVAATSGGIFTSSSVERTTISGDVQTHPYSEDGTYAVTGTQVTLTFNSDGASVAGTLRGDSLVFTGGGFPVVYRRQ